MNIVKELMIDYDLTLEEAEEYLRDMADRLKDESKYYEDNTNG